VPTRALADAALVALQGDFDELAHRASSMRHRIAAAHREIEGAQASFHPATARCALADLARSAARLTRIEDEAHRLFADAGRPGAGSRLDTLTAGKSSLAEMLRPAITQAAAAIVATDWQSPSFAHAVHSSAGRATGRITEHLDDYQRDRHADAAEFEQAYLREYVDGAALHNLRALM